MERSTRTRQRRGNAKKPNAFVPTEANEENRVSWMRLANLQFTARLTRALLQHCGGDPRELFAADDRDLAGIVGFGPRNLSRLRDDSLTPTDKQIAWMDRYAVRLITLGNPSYPRSLADIDDPPAMLFVRGVVPETSEYSVGVVGSRHATPYGRSVAEKLCGQLAQHGLVVVSGGAVGIDTAAHRGAVKVGGVTIGVLGCGLDIDYPRDNRALFEQILENGALISEYPLGSQPEAWRFPLRNRIIAGMALGVLVVEAPARSGALNTARYAVEQGKILMAIPGNVDRATSEGSNALIKDGAGFVTDVNDILRYLGLVAMPATADDQRSLVLDGAEAGVVRESTEPPALARPNAARTLDLPESQRRLLEALSLTPAHIDVVADDAGMTAAQAGVEITLLELAGLVRRLPGATYIRVL